MAEQDRSTEGLDEVPLLTLVEPMLGFDDQRHFALVRLDPDGLLCALRSVDTPDLRFLVVPPGPFFEDYAPEIPDETVERLQVREGDPVVPLVVVTPGDAPDRATANLLAPVVLNLRTRLGAQVVQAGDLPVREPLWAGARA